MNELQTVFQGSELRPAQLAMLEADLPEPPDNFDSWNDLPEDFREKVANQFTCGIEAGQAVIRERVQQEYATARARHAETVEMRKEREARRDARRDRGRRRA